MTVFLVDDDSSVRKALTRLIRAAGYEIKAFSSAREFIESKPETAGLACLVLDVRMPGQHRPEAGHTQLHRLLDAIGQGGHARVRMLLEAEGGERGAEVGRGDEAGPHRHPGVAQPVGRQPVAFGHQAVVVGELGVAQVAPHATKGDQAFLGRIGNYEVVDREDGTKVGLGRFAHIWTAAPNGAPSEVRIPRPARSRPRRRGAEWPTRPPA